MKILASILLLLTLLSGGEMPELTHGLKYKDQNISGWLMSEKLDGVRAVWDGEKLCSRRGNSFHPHPVFISNLPPFPLDGELWTRRNDFETIASIVNDSNESSRWLKLTYNIFEVPNAGGDFLARLDKARRWFKTHPNPHVRIIEHKPVRSDTELKRFLAEIESKGGEGAMVKNPFQPYTPGRNAHLLKVKSYEDMEGWVIDYKAGKGRFEGMVGSLHIELPNGIRFYLGSGLSLEERKNPPPLGSLITFKYYGLTKTGKPRFASFMRVRNTP